MRVCVVCKDALVKDGLLSILNHDGQFAVGGGSDLVDTAVRMLGPDPSAVLVVVTDGLEPEDWVDLGESKVERRFNLVMIVSNTSSAAAFKIADAVVRNTEGANALIEAVRRFVGTATPLERQMGTKNPVFIADSLQQSYGGRRLTRRELEVAQYVAQGLGNRRISQVLNLQEQSVKNLVSSIMRKLNCENRTQVALKLTGQPQAS
jgi:DNA-binding NarL/FixJ family response regulator